MVAGAGCQAPGHPAAVPCGGCCLTPGSFQALLFRGHSEIEIHLRNQLHRWKCCSRDSSAVATINAKPAGNVDPSSADASSHPLQPPRLSHTPSTQGHGLWLCFLLRSPCPEPQPFPPCSLPGSHWQRWWSHHSAGGRWPTSYLWHEIPHPSSLSGCARGLVLVGRGREQRAWVWLSSIPAGCSAASVPPKRYRERV